MFNFFKKKNKEEKDKDESVAVNISIFNSAKESIKEAEQKFKKPQTYDRSLIDDGKAKKNIKIECI